MATTTVTYNANVNPALANLRKLERQMENVNKTFSGFGRLLGGIAILTFIGNILRSSDAIDELSKATGIGIAEINGLSSAFIANGGDAEDASKAVTKFAQTIDEAAQGSAKTQFQFQQLGISLTDLQTLSESDLLRKTIQGLSKLPAGAQRTAIAMDLLGKNVRTVDFEGLNQDLDGFIAKSKQAEPGIKNAADLFGNLQNIGKAFTTELLNSGQGISAVLVDLTKNTESIAKSLTDLTKIALALGGAFLIFGKVLPALRTFGNVIVFGTGMLKKQMVLLGISFVAIFKNLAKIVPAFAKLFGLVTRFGGMTSLLFALKAIATFGARFLGIAGIIYGVAKAVDFVVEKFTGFSIFDTVGKKASMLGQKIKQLAVQLGILDAEPTRGTPKGPQGPRRLGKEERERLREVAAANKALANSIQDVTDKYKDQNDQIVRNLGLEASYLKMNEMSVEIAKTQQDIYDRAVEAISELQRKKSELKPEEKGLADQIVRQIEIIEKSMMVDQMRAENAIKNVYAIKQAQEELIKQNELINQQMSNDLAIKNLQDQIALIGLYGDELDQQQMVLNVTQELESKLLQLREKELDLIAKKGQLSDEQFQKEMAHINQLRTMAYEYAGARIDAETQVQEAQKITREDETGAMKKRLEELARSVDPAVTAVAKLDSVFNNMENAIDNFVETGKFKFKDFARSVIADLIAIQLKAAATKVLSSIFTKIFGLAEGGPAKANQPYIVGEKGPELFVPNSSGTVVPNNKLNQGRGVATGAVNAPVTNNYITNNISAIDAKSVAQLFAENRKTLLGTVRMAEKEMPYMGRA